MNRDNRKYNKNVSPNTAFVEKLRTLLPEYFTTEKYDEDGNIIDTSKFDKLKFDNDLAKQNVEELSSGYRIDFIGKNYAKKQSGERPTTVIVPDMDHNNREVNKDSKNLFFTGDNLHVLRHLQQNYEKSVDIIYIDPPYNTGSDDFVYPDKFEYSDEQLIEMFGLNDEELIRLKSIQGKSTHSAWLTFMYPRLYLGKKLLTDDGVIFVSIDDNEQANLKLLMDEIFGEGNFLAQVVWERAYAPINLKKNFSESHDYILAYSRNINGLKTNGIARSESQDSRYSNPDNDSRGSWKSSDFSVGPAVQENIYEIITPSGRRVLPPSGYSWRYSKKRYNELLNDNRVWFGDDGNNVPSYKRFLSEVKQGITPMTVWSYEEVGHSQSATQYLKKLMDDKAYFTYPKPVPLIKRLIQLYDKPDAVIMDFFAGSATTAEAVMELNTEDSYGREYILVQLDEPTWTLDEQGNKIASKGNEVAFNDGYLSISEIARERISKAANKLINETLVNPQNTDLGFKHYYVVKPYHESLSDIDFSESDQVDMFDRVLSSYSAKNLHVFGSAEGRDTILQTYLAQDGYKFDISVEFVDFFDIKIPYVNKQRIYIIEDEWNTKNTKSLINAIGTNEIDVQTVVVYGNTMKMESLRELEIALKQIDRHINLLVRY